MPQIIHSTDSANLADVLERILNLYRNYEEGGDVSQLQVDQVELELLTGR